MTMSNSGTFLYLKNIVTVLKSPAPAKRGNRGAGRGQGDWSGGGTKDNEEKKLLGILRTFLVEINGKKYK